MGSRYSDPKFDVPQVVSMPVVGVAAAANDELGRFRAFTRCKVLEARAIIGRTVGKADTSAIDIYKGTASIGSITVGTNAEGTVVDASLTDTEFESTDDLVLKNITATDTFAANVFIQFQQLFE